MAKEIIGFWNRLEYFLVDDEETRWKAIGSIILVVGSCASIDFALLDSKLDDVVFLMGVLALMMSIAWIGWYCSFRRILETKPFELSRRYFFRDVRYGVLTMVGIVLAVFIRRTEEIEAESRLQSASIDPSDPKAAQEALAVLTVAREGNIQIKSLVIERVGTRFIRSAKQNEVAWPVVKACLSYRSFVLNPGFVPKLTPTTGKSKYREAVTVTAIPPSEGYQKAFQVSYAGGHASGDKAARLEQLSNPQPEGSEFAFFIIDGGNATIGLDNAWMRNVIIRNSDISYAGGQVRLENVWFVKCTFHGYSQVTPTTMRLGETILASTSVVFSELA